MHYLWLNWRDLGILLSKPSKLAIEATLVAKIRQHFPSCYSAP